jgi:hypothetical protein
MTNRPLLDPWECVSCATSDKCSHFGYMEAHTEGVHWQLLRNSQFLLLSVYRLHILMKWKRLISLTVLGFGIPFIPHQISAMLFRQKHLDSTVLPHDVIFRSSWSLEFLHKNRFESFLGTVTVNRVGGELGGSLVTTCTGPPRAAVRASDIPWTTTW